MRTPALAIAISVGANAALVALVHSLVPDSTSAASRPGPWSTTTARAIDANVEPLIVTLLEPVLEEPATSVRIGAEPRQPQPPLNRHRHDASASAAAGRAATETAVAPETRELGAAPAAPGSRWFDLRRNRGTTADLRLPRGFRDDLDAVPRGTDAVRGAPATGQLQPSGRGTYFSELADKQGFTASVDREGTMTLKDKPSFTIEFPFTALFDPVATVKSFGRCVTAWYYGPKGAEAENLAPCLDPNLVSIAKGDSELTDALMRAYGQDPYASAKLKLLDSTRVERVQIQAEYREQQRHRTPQIVLANLESAWRSIRDPRARRAALFELWDEVVEAGDEKSIEAGLAGRRLIVGFIRARLPAGSPDAYTEEELATLNGRRQSRAPFAPYE